MKILYIINNGFEAGGAEKSVLLLKSNLENQGHSVYILSTDNKKSEVTFFADYALPKIKGTIAMKLIKRAWNRSNYIRIKKICESIRPDVIHIHTMSEFSPSVFWLGKKYPMLFTIHGPEEFIICLYPWLLPASDYRKNNYNQNELKMSGQLRKMYYRYIQRPIYIRGLRYVHVIISPSKFMQTTLLNEVPKITTTHIYNGINQLASNQLKDSKAARLLYVGRLERVKGVDVLLKAFAKLRDDADVEKLCIIGDGSDKKYLMKMANDLHIQSKVEFKGWMQESKVITEIGNSNIVIIPSVWPENLPTIGIEALSVGRPLIGSNVGGIPELIEHNVNGYLVPAADVSALTNSINNLIHDHTLQNIMARKALHKAKIFSSKSFCDAIIKIYEDVLV